MRAAFLMLAVALLCSSCASIEPPHPTPEHHISGCYLACPAGYALRRQHICHGDRTQFVDLIITGEEVEPGNPSEDRWITGVNSIGVEHEVLTKLKAEGVSPTDRNWSDRFRELAAAVRAEVGTDAVETYLKIDVIAGQTCNSVMQMRAASRATEQRGLAERVDSKPPGQQ